MQRILQPGDIESLDRTSFPHAMLPRPQALFRDRAARLRQLADGNPIADYLRFVARLVDAQHSAAQTLQLPAPDAAAIARAQQFGMPLLPAAESLAPDWQQVLGTMLQELSGEHGLPSALQPLIGELQALDTAGRDAIAQRLLTKELAARDVGLAPFVMAALQVVFAVRAGQLDAADIPYADPATACPVCGGEPVASVLRISGQASGHRYLHCGCCATEWHMVRVKCSHCESTKGIHYQAVQGGKDVVVAETCNECGSYRKLVNQEKDPFAEPLADDLATLTLDLLMNDTAFRRASGNPLLYVAVAEPQ